MSQMQDASTQTEHTPTQNILQIINPQVVAIGAGIEEAELIIPDKTQPPSKRKRVGEPTLQQHLSSYHGDDKDYFLKLPQYKKKQILQEEKRLLTLNSQKTPIRFKILTSNMSDKLKAYALKKLDMLNMMDPSSGEYNKLMTFLEAVSKIPIGQYKELSYKSSTSVGSFLNDTKNKLDKAVFGHNECKDQIIRLLAQWISNPKSQGLVIGIEGPMGCGKCHAKDTPILMYDGTTKMVQDIIVGDVIMGDDCSPRNVLALGHGQDQMYDVIYVNQWGEKYTVNSEHILCLLNLKSNKVEEISIKDFISLPDHIKSQYVGMRAVHRVVFNHYSKASALTEEQIQHIISNHHIPYDVLTSSVRNRQNVFSKIMSHYSCFPLIKHSNKTYLNEIKFLARSLGITCYMIEDDLYIPKVYGYEHLKIKVIPSIVDDYYGFMIDGNSRYIMGDFTITHNTTLVKHGICKALGLPFGFIPLGGISDGSFLIGHSYTYEGSRWGRIIDILMTSECMNPILFFDELDKVSNTRYGEEIINILIHLTDASQNTDFHDKYFADLPLDLSRCLIVFSYNNGELINPILRDRMVTIQTSGYNHKDKVMIAKNYMFKEIYDKYNFKKNDILISDDVLDHIINKTQEEKGVRNLKRSIEDIISRLNLKKLVEDDPKFSIPYNVSMKDIDTYLQGNKIDNPSLSMMYM